MWPWGHLAVAYLCYIAVVRLRGKGEQTLPILVAVALGSQFPDLVDKPLAWSFTLLPSGRSFAHSLLTAALVLGIVYWLARRHQRDEVAVAFGISYLSHSLVDLGPEVVVGLLQGDLSYLQWTTYLLWPLLPAPPYPSDSSFLEHFLAFNFDPYVLTQFGLFGVALAVWLATGAPGVVALRQGVRKLLHSRT